MQIRPTNNIQNTAAIKLQPQSTTQSTSGAGSLPVDQLDISPEAQLMSASATGDIRTDRVADIKAQIASGQYETMEKLDAAVGRMFSELG